MDLMNGEHKAAYLAKLASAQSGMGAGMQHYKKRTVKIDRHGMISNEYSRRIYPLDFTVPFNPLDLEDKSFDSDHRFVFPGSATSAYLMYRDMMLGNLDLLKKTCSYLQVPETIFTSAAPGIVSEEEFEAVKKWRLPKSSSAPVISTQFSDRQNTKYPTLYLADCELDFDGSIVDNGEEPLFQTLYKLESECLSCIVADVRAQYEAGGPLAHKTAKDQKDEVTKVWSSRLISKPFYKYALRYLHIVCDPQTYAPVGPSAEAWNNHKFENLDCIKVSGMDTMLLIKKCIGTPKDAFMDFVEMEWENPEITKAQEAIKGTLADKVTKAQCSPSESLFLPIKNKPAIMEGFVEMYRAYLDDTNMWNDTVTRANVREFTALRDDVLLTKFQFDIGRYSEILKDPEIHAMFDKANIDTSSITTTEVLSGMMSGETKAFKISAEDRVDQQDLAAMKNDDVLDTPDEGMDFADLMQAKPTTTATGAPVEDEFAGLMDN